MSATDFSYKISGADKFQLLLDRHIRLRGYIGNVISLGIEVKGRINADELRKVVNENTFLTQINSLKIEEGFLRIPRWKAQANQKPVKIIEHPSEQDAVDIKPDIKVNSGNLLHLDLLQNKSNSTLIISAHHVLADNMGIQAIAKIIAGNIQPAFTPFTKEENEAVSIVRQLVYTLKATRLVFNKTPKKLAKLLLGETETGSHIIRFTQEETKQIEQNAVKNGARISKSAFYLAATSMALQQTVFAKTSDSFFIPVPQNQRLRGNEQTVLGNHLSFLFYTIPFNKLTNLTEATEFINEQMMQQVRDKSPKSYSYLLKTFRFLPLSVYDFFFKLPTKGAVCSFLFSDVGETLSGMKTFMGKEITEVLNYPPNPCPPHITFVVMKHTGALKIITAYNPGVISSYEITRFEEKITELLLP